MSLLRRCPPYSESKKITEERQGPTLEMSDLGRRLLYRESKKMSDKRQGPIPGVRLLEPDCERYSSVRMSSCRSALDSTHQNHIDREGLRLTFGHLVTNVGRFANESFRQRSFRKRLRSVRKYLWSVRKRVEVSSQTLSTFICVEASSVRSEEHTSELQSPT